MKFTNLKKMIFTTFSLQAVMQAAKFRDNSVSTKLLGQVNT